MATITTILATDIIAASRVTINTNFSNLNTDKVDVNSTYADPAWLTSLAGSKITGNIGGNAATATALATARTIAGVSFDGTANIAIASTNLSDTGTLVRNNAANTYTAGTKQTFASSATTAGAAFGGGITADPSSVAAGDFWYRADLGTFGFRNATAVDALVAGGRNIASGQVLYGTAAGVAGSESSIIRVGAGQLRAIQYFVGGDNLSNIVESNGLTINSGVAVRPIRFQINSVDVARFATTTGNLLLGTSTDNNFRLDIAASGSSGTLRAYDQTPTTGVTQLLVRAGAGQGSTNLQTWQNAAGGVGAAIDNNFNVSTTTNLIYSGSNNGLLGGSYQGLRFRDNNYISWSATNSYVGTADASLSRASANVIQVGDGGANALGQIRARSLGGVNSGGVLKFFQFDNALRISSDSVIAFHNATNADGGSASASLSFPSAGVIQAGDGAINSNGRVWATAFRAVGVTVANLPPAAGNAGMRATVTDANATTIGTTVAGGGANTVLVWSNGTNWRIYAN